MRTPRFFAALLIALTLLASGGIAPKLAVAATDSPITMAITATVDEVVDLYGLLNVRPGDTITGTYTYNAAAVNQSPTPGVGSYRHTTAPYGIRLNVGGTIIETDPDHVNFNVYLSNNRYGRDSYAVSSVRNIAVGQYNVTSINWALYDLSQTALKNVNLPKTAPKLSDWQQADETWGLTVQGIDLDPASEFELIIRAHVTQVVKL